MKKINIATVFSGIGAPEQALKKLGFKTNIVFACDNGEIEIKDNVEDIKKVIDEMDDKSANAYVKKLYSLTKKKNYVKISYFANYKIKEDNWYDDIRFLNGEIYKNKVDLLVGGSPCQSFSIIGKRAGLEDTRGTLFYDYARLIKQVEPKVFVYENVPGMMQHDHGNTWNVILTVFESLGYKIYYSILNARDYGIPQDRKRLFVVGFRDNSISFKFPQPIKLEKDMKDFLEEDVAIRHYLGKKGFEFVTSHPSRARVGTEIMGCQKANQQFNWNGDFIFEKYDHVKNNPEILNKAYVFEWNGKKGVIRKYTPRECLRLMGFSDDFKIVINDQNMYRQSGNSIVVNVLKELVTEIIETGVFKND